MTKLVELIACRCRLALRLACVAQFVQRSLVSLVPNGRRLLLSISFTSRRPGAGRRDLTLSADGLTTDSKKAMYVTYGDDAFDSLLVDVYCRGWLNRRHLSGLMRIFSKPFSVLFFSCVCSFANAACYQIDWCLCLFFRVCLISCCFSCSESFLCPFSAMRRTCQSNDEDVQ